MNENEGMLSMMLSTQNACDDYLESQGQPSSRTIFADRIKELQAEMAHPLTHTGDNN